MSPVPPKKQPKNTAAAKRGKNTPPKILTLRKKAFTLRVDSTTQIAELSLDVKDSKVNVLRVSVLEELSAFLKELRALPVRLLVIKSGKAGSFIAGADILEIKAAVKNGQLKELIKLGQQTLTALSNFKAPTLAVIDGHAFGGGLELALACTYRVVSRETTSRLGLPEVTLGIIPGFGGTQRLPALIGLPRALKMMLSGKMLTAQEAYNIGLAHDIVPSAYLNTKLPKLAEKIIRDPQSVQAATLRRRRKHFSRFQSLLVRLGLKFIIRRTAKQLRQNMGTHYPAPFELLDVLRKSYPATTQAQQDYGMQLELVSCSKLLKHEVTSNLLKLFEYNNALKNQPITIPAPFASTRPAPQRKQSKRQQKAPKITQGWVIGGGTMGSGIAWFLSHGGLPTRIKETSWDIACSSYQKLRAIHHQRERRAGQKARVTQQELARSSFTTTWNPIHSNTLVIEATAENLALKQQLFKELEAHCHPEAILATNTSSLSVNAIAAKLKHSERFLAIHFFNPVHRMQLVELAPAPKTDSQLFNAVATLLRRGGKLVVPVKACPGFLVNRILFAYLNEALHLLAETKAVELIDTSLKEFGMPMGPFALMDQVGIDICAHAGENIAAAYNNTKQFPSEYKTLLNLNWLGKKNEKGFYVYAGSKPIGLNPELYSALYGESAAMKRSFKPAEIVERLILAMAREALLALENEVVRTHWELDLALLYGSGFPAFRGGILRYVDAVTPIKTLKKIERLRDFYGERFTPPPLLEQLVKRNKKFYND